MTTLLIASGGGHLKQLHRLMPRLTIGEDRLWVTFDTGLSRSLLEDENVVFAPYAHPHDVRGTARNALLAMKLVRAQRFERAISTGANLAVSFLPVARVSGARADYIETATRANGPSLTGRVLQRVPGIHLYTQHARRAHGRWHYGGSVFEGFWAEHTSTTPAVKKIVVSLGSNDSYPFPRLVYHLLKIIPAGVEVLWQLGSTPLHVPFARASVPAKELESAMREADVVIAHAGTGAALSALEAGKFPVLVPRRAAHNEHVDDHQELTSEFLSNIGLALAAEAEELTWDDICAAASWRVGEGSDVVPFQLMP